MNQSLICRTCGKPISQPYRVFSETGAVLQGCIDADHDNGNLQGVSADWHNRPEAKQYRRDFMTRFNRVLLGNV